MQGPVGSAVCNLHYSFKLRAAQNATGKLDGWAAQRPGEPGGEPWKIMDFVGCKRFYRRRPPGQHKESKDCPDLCGFAPCNSTRRFPSPVEMGQSTGRRGIGSKSTDRRGNGRGGKRRKSRESQGLRVFYFSKGMGTMLLCSQVGSLKSSGFGVDLGVTTVMGRQ